MYASEYNETLVKMKYFENYRIQYKLIGKFTLPDLIGI